ncbi:PH domain-containing protein [Kineococcus glutinatus]|uniref:PH domain-containing protein n=1 Tax=Kineococcus glutinatus TaxID=1070872 RepID=UPI0031EBC433
MRAPRWTRIYICLFAVVWLGLLGSFAVQGLREADPGALITVPMAALGIFLFSGLFLLRTRTEAGELVVRNVMRTRRIRREDVEDVRTGKPQGGPLTVGEAVLVLVRDGSMVSLEATMRTGWTARGRQELIDSRERLLAWTRTTR